MQHACMQQVHVPGAQRTQARLDRGRLPAVDPRPRRRARLAAVHDPDLILPALLRPGERKVTPLLNCTREEILRHQRKQLSSLNSSFEELARQLEAKRQALTAVLSKRFEAEKQTIDEKATRQVTKSEKDLQLAETGLSKLKT